MANIVTATVVISEIMAKVQLPFAISTPVPASDNPISIITGPTTTGGNILEMNPTPRNRTNALIMQYTAPTAANPDNVPGSPYSSVAFMIGAMKAKLLPRKIGTLPLVIR